MTASLPEYNNKIIAAASLAPIGYMNHMTSPLLKLMSYWTGTLSVSLKIYLNYKCPNLPIITDCRHSLI